MRAKKKTLGLQAAHKKLGHPSSPLPFRLVPAPSAPAEHVMIFASPPIAPDPIDRRFRQSSSSIFFCCITPKRPSPSPCRKCATPTTPIDGLTGWLPLPITGTSAVACVSCALCCYTKYPTFHQRHSARPHPAIRRSVRSDAVGGWMDGCSSLLLFWAGNHPRPDMPH